MNRHDDEQPLLSVGGDALGESVREGNGFQTRAGLVFGRWSAIVGLMTADHPISSRVCPGRGGLAVILSITGLLSCFPLCGRDAETLPAASEVTRRMIERAQAVARAEQGPQYTYKKRSLHEHLDAAGRVLTSEEKIYLVTLIADVPVNRLVKIKGRELSGEELRSEEAREERLRQKFVSAGAKKSAARKEGWVTQELLDRFQFEVKERVNLNNRPTLLLTFKPKERILPSGTFEDKLLSGMAGSLWIDEGDADTARLVVSLGEPVSIGWFGLLGSLNQCDLTLERQRMPDGVWVNVKQVLLVQCRKLTAAMRFRFTEESSGVRKVEVN